MLKDGYDEFILMLFLYSVKMTSVLLLTVFQLNFVILFLHVFVEGQGDIPQCSDNGSKLVGETCYKFNAPQVTWHQAKSNCESQGMTLAYVSSFDQAKQILSGYTFDVLVWIGASDEKKEGEFIWVASNETATELTHLWEKSEPNNKTSPIGDEDCVGIWPIFYANDAPCNLNFSYLCMEKSCPYNLKVGKVLNDRVSLSWRHYLKTDPSQTFTVKSQDLVSNMSRVVGTVTISRGSQNSSRTIDYHVSGLQSKTPYKVYVDASNNDGKASCKSLTVNTKTTGPPECPVNITTSDLNYDRVSLSWTPGQEDELPQTFTILAHNVSVFNNISFGNVLIGSVHANKYERVMYTVANLSELTHYTFSVDVKNNFGITKCKDNFLQVTTTSGLQKRSFPAWLIFLLIFIPLVLATGVAGFFVYKRKANRAEALQMETFPASFEKSDHDSIYHSVEEAAVAMIRDIDDGHGYDLTIDDPDLEVFKSNLFKRESIAPLPPPRSSEKNKLISICSDVSQYDVCGAHDIDQPYMKIDNSTSQNIASLREEDNNLIENDVVLISVNKGDNNSLHTSFGNLNKIPESAGINSSSNTFIEFKNNTNENSSTPIAQKEHQYSSHDMKFKTENEESVKTLKAKDSFTREPHSENTSQELDSKIVGNSTKILKENKTPQANDKDIDCKKNENSKSLTRDLADTESYQGCYSSPLIRSDAHIYAPLSCIDSRIILMLKEQEHNAHDEQRDEHANDLTDTQKVVFDFKKEINEIEKSRVPNIELTDQADNADNSLYIPPMLNNFVIEKDFAMRDDDSNKRKAVAGLQCIAMGLAGDIVSSNNRKVEDNEYITPLDSETYPMMFNGDEIGTKLEDINKENRYLKFDGAQCEDDIQLKPGCENKEEYLTWDGGDVSCDKDVLNKYIPIFSSSSRQVVLDENSRKAEPAANQCVDNFKVGNSEIQEDVLVYWTSDGTKKKTFGVAKQLSPDECSAPNDYLKNY
ncbi:unnamed protein product [Lymnaea stagnalis]|uniref:C-type lectin domain-containing protein n=1 Tax=Lymnaea stagnalis TaxID=6523 RepID=A0AAV2I797_LYMST